MNEELWNQISEDIVEEERQEVYIPRKRPQVKELITKYDYCEYFARILGKPVGYVLGRTKGIPLEWMYEQWSFLKNERGDKKIALMAWLKKVQPR